MRVVPQQDTTVRALRPALRFVQAVREDPVLAAELQSLDPDDGLRPVLELAARRGLTFGPEDLRAAHRVDWGLRCAGYLAPT